jgi:hypothetical protein
MERATEDRSQSRTVGSRRSRSSGRVVLACVVVLVAALWVIYWYGASQVGAAVIDRLATAAAARGYAAECEDIIGGGFPLTVGLACSRASLAGAADGMHVAVDGFSLTTLLYRPWRVRSAAVGPLVVSLPESNTDLTATWQEAETSLDAGIGVPCGRPKSGAASPGRRR